jgi:hypothetical protein
MIGRVDDDDDENSSFLRSAPPPPSQEPPSLTQPLRGIFFLNGVILALPTTALLYMVNIHVNVPVSWIPSYISLSFLPYSLKPVYAYLTSSVPIERDVQISTLLICSGLLYIMTAFIPSHAIIFFFLLGFLRSMTTAWPDLLLDLVLIDEATSLALQPVEEPMERSSYAVTAAAFQSQAATDRSLGCIVAHVFVLLLLWKWTHPGYDMNTRTFQFIFMVAGACNFVSALITWHYSIGRASSTPARRRASPDADRSESLPPIRTPSYDSLESPPRPATGATLEIDAAKEPLLSNTEPWSDRRSEAATTLPENPNNTSKVWLVVLLQTWIVLLTLRQPIVQATTSIWVWTAIAVASLLAVLVVAYPLLLPLWCWKKNESTVSTSTHQLRVGLFLILRYAVPSISYLMSSYVYTTFQEFPFLLQLLSLLDMLITTLSCWAYSKYLSRYSSGNQLWWLIGITTALAGIASFGNVVLIRILNPEIHLPYSLTTKVLCTVAINAVMGFFNEWKFLPDLVLATISIDSQPNPQTSLSEQQPTADPNDAQSHATEPELHETASSSSTTVGMQYGTLMSCIDFGGQIGALAAGPLVAWLGTTRENHWQHLALLQELNSTLILCSIALLFLVAR